MLKIYRKTIICDIHDRCLEHNVSHTNFYTIEEESNAKSSIQEYSLYSDDITKVCQCFVYDKKKGRVVWIYANDGPWKFKQWKQPDANLVEYVHYKECPCSMDQLFRLSTDKVIAYLKQEGINLSVSS